MGFDTVEGAAQLLKYGVPGLAIILLFLGYRLLTQVINKSANGADLKLRLLGVGGFIFASLLFLFGSIFGEAYLKQQENTVYLEILPSKMPSGMKAPSVRQSMKTRNLDEGQLKLTIKDREHIRIDLTDIVRDIELDRMNKALLSQIKLSK